MLIICRNDTPFMPMPDTGAVVVLCTAPQGEADMIADMLISSRIAACVNILPVRSRYEWKGEVCVDEEHLLIIKTTAERLESLIDRIRTHHSYEVPEIIALPVAGGSPDYLAWIRDTVR